MSKIEQETNLSKQEVIPPRFKELPVAHPKTKAFLKTSIEEKVYFMLTEEERRLIGMYYFLPGVKLKDLRSFVHPQTGNRVKIVIFESLEKVWENLSEELKDKFPKEDVIKLKHPSYSSEHIHRMQLGRSDETRKKLSIQGKRVGFSMEAETNRLKRVKGRKRSKKTREAISEALLKRWEDQEFRKRMLSAWEERNPARVIWKTAEEEGITPKVIEKGLMTEEEISILRSYFKREIKLRGKNNDLIYSLIEKFSISVANMA